MDALFDPRAFALGMIALINPCGFALLPAYLGFFLGLDDEDGERRSVIRSLSQAQKVGLSMSAGFLAVFATLGLFLAGTLTALNDSGWLPRLTIAIGVGLVALGVAMAFGYQPVARIPKLNKGGGSRSVASMFLFGVSYAVASLSCTIGIFLGTIGTSASGATFAERLGKFISYAIGMGLLATVLTLAVGFGKKGLVTRFRSLLPRINMISSVILVVVGIYVALYGIWSQQVLSGADSVTPWINSIITTAEGWQASMVGWLDGEVTLGGLLPSPIRRTSVLGWSFLIINVTVVVLGVLAARNRRPKPGPASELA